MKDFQTIPDDLVRPFQLENGAALGRLVRLGPALDVLLRRHAYPENVAHILGEAVVIAAALGTALKFDGVFTLQTKTDGAIRLLVVDVTSDGALRAYAQYDETRLTEKNLLGHGHLVFTVDQQTNTDRYQGLVPLTGDNLSEAVQHYFRQSEQIPTGLFVAVRQDSSGHWRGGSLMLQRMPREGGLAPFTDTATEDDWHRAMFLMQTCTPDELVDSNLSPEMLLTRLFHEDGVRAFDVRPLRHQCRCSSERVAAMIHALPPKDVEDLAVNGTITVTCEFCNKTYDLSAAQSAESPEEP